MELTFREQIIMYILASFLAASLAWLMYKTFMHYNKLKRKYMRIFAEDDGRVARRTTHGGASVKAPHHSLNGNLVKDFGSGYPISDSYTFQETLLGRGSSASVVMGVSKRNYRRYAVKLVDMRKASVAWRYDREQGVLKDVDHVNIVRLYEMYRKDLTLYFVMELCSGGHLGSVLMSAGGRINESTVKKYASQLTRAIAHCHKRGICHRDIKLQNVLLESSAPDAQIKLIDFGNSARFREICPMTKIVGTTYTIAPEVFKQCYDERCDVWSVGVVMFILLSGRRPFESTGIVHSNPQSRESSVIANILMGRYNFLHDAWDAISEDAIFFIKACLEPNYLYRDSIEEVSRHAWLLENEDYVSGKHGSEGRATNALPPIQGISLAKARDLASRLQNNVYSSRLRRNTMLGVAFLTPLKKLRPLRDLFQQIDREGVGYITRDKFRVAFAQLCPTAEPPETDHIFDCMDQNANETVSFNEFVAATMDARGQDLRQLNQAYRLLDKDQKGYINVGDVTMLLSTGIMQDVDGDGDGARQGLSASNLEALESDMNRRAAERAEQTVSEADMDRDGVVSYKEFLYAMADQPKAPVSSSLGSDRGSSGGVRGSMNVGEAGGEPLRKVPFRPHGIPHTLQRGESSESIGEQRDTITPLPKGHQSGSINRRSSDSSLKLSSSVFRRRENSITSMSMSTDKKQHLQQKRNLSFQGALYGGVVSPSALMRGGGNGAEDDDEDEDEDEDDDEDEDEEGQGGGAASSASAADRAGQDTSTTTTAATSETRRNSMLEKPTPDVPTILELMTEDIKAWTHKTIGSRLSGRRGAISGDSARDTILLANSAGGAEAGAGAGAGADAGTGAGTHEGNASGDEDADEDLGDMWGDDEDDEAAERELSLLQIATRRMSSPALMWSNFRRRSSLALSRANISMLRGATRSSSPSSPLNDTSAAGHAHSPGGALPSATGSEAEELSSLEMQCTSPSSAADDPSSLGIPLHKRERRTSDTRKRRGSNRSSGSRPDSGRTSPGPVQRAASQSSTVSHGSSHDAADGGVYVLDEGPMLLHEAAAAAAHKQGQGSPHTKYVDNDDLTVASKDSLESSDNLGDSESARLARAGAGAGDGGDVDPVVQEVIQTLNDSRAVLRGYDDCGFDQGGGGGLGMSDQERQLFNVSTTSDASPGGSASSSPASKSENKPSTFGMKSVSPGGNRDGASSRDSDGGASDPGGGGAIKPSEMMLTHQNSLGGSSGQDLGSEEGYNGSNDDGGHRSPSVASSRDHTLNWDLDHTTLSDASDKLQTLVKYLRQQEDQGEAGAATSTGTGTGSGSGAATVGAGTGTSMTPEQAQELSERLTRHLDDIHSGGSGSGSGTGGGAKKEGSESGNRHSHSGVNGTDISLPADGGSISVASHASNLLNTFASAFKAGLMVGRNEGGAPAHTEGVGVNNNDDEVSKSASRDVDLDLESGLALAKRDKPAMMKVRVNSS